MRQNEWGRRFAFACQPLRGRDRSGSSCHGQAKAQSGTMTKTLVSDLRAISTLRARWMALFLLAGAICFFEYGMLGGRGSASAQESHSKPAGGDLIPLRQVSDPYAVFNGIAIDPVNNVVAMSDVNKKTLLSYDRTVDSTR